MQAQTSAHLSREIERVEHLAKRGDSHFVEHICRTLRQIKEVYREMGFGRLRAECEAVTISVINHSEGELGGVYLGFEIQESNEMSPQWIDGQFSAYFGARMRNVSKHWLQRFSSFNNEFDFIHQSRNMSVRVTKKKKPDGSSWIKFGMHT